MCVHWSEGSVVQRGKNERREDSPLVKLLESHLVGQQRPPELSLVVDEGNLSDGLVVGGLGSELLGDGVGGVLQLLEEGRGNGEVVDSGKGLDLSDVSETERRKRMRGGKERKEEIGKQGGREGDERSASTHDTDDLLDASWKEGRTRLP